MKRERYNVEQIIGTLKQHEGDLPVKELIRQMGITEQTFYQWKSKYGGMEVSNARKLRSLVKENRRLKTMVADLLLDNKILKDVNSKSGRPRSAARIGGLCHQGVSDQRAAGLRRRPFHFGG